MPDKTSVPVQHKFQSIEIQLFGPIIAFIQLTRSSYVLLERYETFQKMSYRNRFQLLGPNGVQNLTIPVVGGRDQRNVPTWDIEIDYSGRWMAEHWRSLESWYNRSPFFFHYGPQVKNILEERPRFLWQLSKRSLEWTAKQLGWNGEIGITNEWIAGRGEAGRDHRNRFLPRNRKDFLLSPYQQVFGTYFETNLSILDLLFNLGPESHNYLLNQSVL